MLIATAQDGICTSIDDDDDDDDCSQALTTARDGDCVRYCF